MDGDHVFIRQLRETAKGAEQTALYISGNDIRLWRHLAMRRILLSTTVLLFCISAVAQVGTQASLTGTVTDTTGAVVADATISATNLATGEVAETKADGRGSFNILALPAGNYRVTAKASGFEAWEIPRINLTVGNRSRLTPVLRVGSSTETVRVQGTTGLMQTDSPTVETVIQMKQIRELPLDTRNPLALVALAPGMFYEGTTVGSFRDSFVQGQGLRNYKTNFQLDGLNSNTSSSEGGTAIPNVDAIEEFNVQTGNAGAEAGRDPSQVLAITKSGTNEFHGTLFEFNQNDFFSARNAFATEKNRVRYNQFGGTIGGPIIKNKTFFFGSYQQTVIGNDVVLNEPAVSSAMENGDFSALSMPITNPYTGNPFPNNQVPASMINPSAKYFLPLFVTATSPDGFYKALKKGPNTTYEYLGRIDHQITSSQRIYGRFEYVREPITVVNSGPVYTSSNTTVEPSFGANYTWAISNNSLLTLTGGFMRDAFKYTNPPLGKQNDSQLAGIEGIPTAGRQAWIGPPDIDIAGYQGVFFSGGGFGAPGQQSGGQYDGKASFSHVQGPHTFEVGGEYFNRTAYGEHGSDAPRGRFGFYNNYTGNGFADYLLGLTSSSALNDPLGKFGETLDPILAGYGEDTWKVTPNLTLRVGLRYERYLSHKCFANICSVWNPHDNKVVVSTDAKGQPNLTHFPTSAALAVVTQGLWETAQQAGYPRGLYEANGQWEPRLGFTYRPFGKSDLIVRAAYGIYYSLFTGNAGASEINIPTWAEYTQNFGLNTLQPWETVWASGPTRAASNFTVFSPLVNLKPAETQESNVSIQTEVPFKAALTLSYVATRTSHEESFYDYNAATVGFHENLQAAYPHAAFSSILANSNQGKNWYNGLQAKLERRFENGLSFTAAYAWSKTMAKDLPDGEFNVLLPFSPAWYNRHVTTFGYPQIESATLLWELPYGHSRRFGSNARGIVDTLLGGWQLSVLQTAHSGGRLEITQNGGNLGNGYSSRTDLIGNPHVPHPNKNEWFNTAAFAAAPLYTFGNSGVGAVNGPGGFTLNTGVDKSFYVRGENYLQFRWETFNLPNRVNYNNPDTTFGDSAFGQLTSSDSARYMQFGLKFVF
jgi:hypothetical protein